MTYRNGRQWFGIHAAIRDKLEEAVKKTAVYLRPETAQAMFVQFLNVQQSMSMKVPSERVRG